MKVESPQHEIQTTTIISAQFSPTFANLNTWSAG